MPQCQFLFSAVFGFRKAILQISSELDETKSQIPMFSDMFQKSEGETKEGSKAPSPYHGAGGPPAAPPCGERAHLWPRPRVAWAPRVPATAALSPIYSSRLENPKAPSLSSRTYSPPPPPSTLTRGVPEALPGTLPERGIITGGLYIAMPASGVMRE